MRGSFVLGEVIGKTISGAYCRENNDTPRRQIFIVFDDDTYIEIYSAQSAMSLAQGVDKGDLDFIRNKIHREGEVVFDSEQNT